ncbi:DUF7541 family protein [Haloterrigena salifodinae]|uniref:Cox cluster protein n=1 Tax=Haloterrigena salifodinae TaxID=2675099 RepID=A0A8T8E318_9EURY|nr:hypothetical protein [Haloterrigena salifodinae]QRV15933.1 hypothetical protein JMJ58_03265 [Haloterrigena salifodinae]
MVDHSSANDRGERDRERPTASPWPVLVAIGLAGSEVGIVVDLLPVAVGGLVLFAASVAGILAESDHVADPLPVAMGFGAVFALGGGMLYALGTDTVAPAATDGLTGLTTRGLAIAIAGIVTVVGTVIVHYRRR